MQPEMYELFNRIEEHHWWFQSRRDIVLRLLKQFKPSRPRLRILDIGCGTGMMVHELREFGDVFGIDPDERAIAYSRKKVNDPSRIAKGCLPNNLPKAQRFDIVTSLDVLEHVEDDMASLYAIKELLEQSGVLFLTVPAFPLLWSGHDEINQHKRRYMIHELKQKLQRAGFRVLKCTYFNTLLFPMAFSYKLYNRLRWGHAPRAHITEVPHPLVNIPLRVIFSVERLLLPHVDFPVGVSLLAIACKNANADSAGTTDKVGASTS